MDPSGGRVGPRAVRARFKAGAGAATGAVILILVATGYVLAADYGLSWDEPDNAVFGQQALQAYLSLRPPAEWHSNLESKGPFFVAAAEAITRLLHGLRPSWPDFGARHFAYFVSFPLAAAALYGLARRMVSPAAALAAVLLFSAQPLLFGHAFINPKDTPFMAFFLVSIWSGLWMVEALGQSTRGGEDRRLPKSSIVRLLVAGAILGLSTAIRLFGPFAGLLVSVLALIRTGRKSLGPLTLYWATAAVACYLTWPYLWGDPIRRLSESLRVMLDFPWDNLVLYRGLVYAAPDLPWHYLPFTTLIQLTEPLVVLALSGMLVGLVWMRKDRGRIALYGMLGLWTAIPYAAAVLGDTTVYDNSRQFLFALPPVFLSAALAFDALFRWIRPILFRTGMVLAALLPGLAAMVHLHPYEYIYYNALVGGVPGAYRQYELDYWATSYRAAMEAVNELAPPGTTIAVSGPWMSAARFARPDLVVVKLGLTIPAGARPPAYFLTLARSNFDLSFMPGDPIVAEVRVVGATLAVVKTPAPAEESAPWEAGGSDAEGTVEESAERPWGSGGGRGAS